LNEYFPPCVDEASFSTTWFLIPDLQAGSSIAVGISSDLLESADLCLHPRNLRGYSAYAAWIYTEHISGMLLGKEYTETYPLSSRIIRTYPFPSITTEYNTIAGDAPNC
jgi:hypothetical protein